MSNPLIQIGDDVREMTDQEVDAWQQDAARRESEAETAAEIAADKAAAAASGRTKLAALGLTDDEINALLGA